VAGNAGPVSERASKARPAQRGRPPKLYRIGEVVDYCGVSRQTIHNYTTMGLLHESRWTAGGHRLYDETVFERLDKIEEFKAANKSLQDIREYFVKLECTAEAAPEDAAQSAGKGPG
jgi:DNA-binding transcriptional MerR regulator